MNNTEYEIGLLKKENMRKLKVLNVESIDNITSELSFNHTFTVSRYCENEIVVDCGKGFTVKDAFYSGLYESCERFSGEKFDKCVIEGQAEELKSNYNLCKPSDFYHDKTGIDLLNMKWCEGRNVISDKKILVPLECVRFPAASEFAETSTVGLASGTSIENAMLHSLYEIIEHDTLTLYTYAGLYGKKIKLEETDEELYEIYKNLTDKGINVELRLLLNDYKVPMVLGMFKNIPEMVGIKVAGMGSSLDVRVAVKRALLECQQSTEYWHGRYLRNDMKEEGVIHPPLKIKEEFISINSEIRLKDMDIPSFQSKKDELETVIEKLSKVTNKIIMVDITDEKLKVPCVKVIIPEFENTIEEKYLKRRAKEFKKNILESISMISKS